MKTTFYLIIAFCLFLGFNLNAMPSTPGNNPTGIEKAQFVGGDKAFQQYIQENLIYPDCARQEAIDGEVIISFFVLADGKIIMPKIEQGISEVCDSKALEVISTMPDWIPAQNNGEALHSRVKVNIKFLLEQEF